MADLTLTQNVCRNIHRETAHQLREYRVSYQVRLNFALVLMLLTVTLLVLLYLPLEQNREKNFKTILHIIYIHYIYWSVPNKHVFLHVKQLSIYYKYLMSIISSRLPALMDVRHVQPVCC